MIDPGRFRQRSDKLSEALQLKLGVRGRGLETRLRRARRDLPRPLRREGQKLINVGLLVDHPKLARLVDPPSVDTAFDIITAHLKKVDPADRRRGALLGLMGGLVFNLLVLVAAVLVLLRWQGFL